MKYSILTLVAVAVIISAGAAFAQEHNPTPTAPTLPPQAPIGWNALSPFPGQPSITRY